MNKEFNKKVTLGRTGLSVSRLGIGAGYGISAKSVEKAFHEYGLNYLYWGSRKKGMKEAIINLAPKYRKDMVVAIQSYEPTGLYLARSLENGLKELKIDQADVLILGWRRSLPGARILSVAQRMKDQGKVKFLAMSGHKRALFAELAKKGDASPMDIFMLRYNAAHRGAEEEVFPYLKGENRPGITSYTATRWGDLLRKDRMPPAEKPLTSAECYRFALSNPHVDLCMIGPGNEKEMDEALLTLEQGPLSEDESLRIRRIGDHVHKTKTFF
jgi:aryl-alcohol dehydrogenase-like predicted oxidoreductase